MNSRILATLVILAAVGALPSVAQAAGCGGGGTWTTELVWEHSNSTYPYADGQSVSVDANDNIYVGGFAWDATPANMRQFVLRSTDGGSSWTLVDDPDDGATSTLLRQIAIDRTTGTYADDVYTAGSKYVSGLYSPQTEGSANGTSFSIVDNPSGLLTWSAGNDTSGNPLVGLEGTTTNNDMVFARSTDGGSTWAEKSYTDTSFTRARPRFIQSDGSVFVAGQSRINADWNWRLWESTDDDLSTMSALDSYQKVAGEDSLALGVAISKNGNILVSGTAYDANGDSFWTIRRSTDGGSTWSTDELAVSTGEVSVGGQIHTDKCGDVWSVGRVVESDGSYRWLVRRSVNQGNSWSTHDDFQYNDGTLDAEGNLILWDSGANSIYSDSAGNVYVVGVALNLTTLRLATVVRKFTR